MKILGMKAVPIARIRMKVTRIEGEDSRGLFSIMEQDNGKTFRVYVRKNVAESLKEGDTIEVLCTPSDKMSISHHAFVVSKEQDGLSNRLHTDGIYWSTEFESMFEVH